MKNKSGKFIIIFLLIVAVVGFFVYKNITNTSPVSKDNTSKVIEIPQGSGTSQIAKILKDNNLIKSEFAFKKAAKNENLTTEFKAGEYELNESMSVYDIFNVITVSNSSDRKDLIKVVIPEGYELINIADKLEDNNLVDKDKFLELARNKNNFNGEYEFMDLLDDSQSLEGYLFPATYSIEPNASEEEIILMMLDAYNRVYETEIKNNLESTGMTLNELMSLASIIEREGRLDEERPIMSSVFYNRIEQGIPLGSCATVQYIIGERKPVLSIADTRIDSPFNTYINKGLPPSPIASPGKVSILAAINPADTDYLFFVLTGKDGSHTFTKTNAEHEEAKKNMIRE